jgi:hypothetical protein
LDFDCTDAGGRATQGAVADDCTDAGGRATQGAVAETSRLSGVAEEGVMPVSIVGRVGEIFL